jgi:hypothetical protein
MADTIVVPNAALKLELGDFVNRIKAGTLRLYSNNVEPSPSQGPSVLIEAAFPGYARVPAPPFSIPFIGGTGIVTSMCPLQTFKTTSPGGSFPIYGWYVLDLSGAVVLLISRIITAPFLLTIGQPLTITPTLQQQPQFVG